MAKKKKTAAATKKKPTKARGPVHDDGVSEADFLLGLATKKDKPATKAAKGPPLVEMPQHAETLKTLADANKKIKDFTGIKKEMEGLLFDDAEESRVGLSRVAGEALSSIKIVGGKTGPCVTVTKKNAYSGMSISEKAAAVEALSKAAGGCDTDVATTMLDERIKWQTTVSLDPAAFKDKAALTAMKKYLKEYLVVKIIGKPTPDFHAQATLQPSEQLLMESLEDFVQPHKASARLGKR